MNNISRLKIGFAITGSFCTIQEILPVMRKLAESGACVIPIISSAVDNTDTRFYEADKLKNEIEVITGNSIIKTVKDAEPIGPKKLIDVLIIAPCTSNTLGKLAHGINDTPVTMAAKSIMRNERPVIISVSTNDGLSVSAQNIGILMSRRNIYIVPFMQDDPLIKQRSLVAKSGLIIPTMINALSGSQIQPILYGTDFENQTICL